MKRTIVLVGLIPCLFTSCDHYENASNEIGGGSKKIADADRDLGGPDLHAELVKLEGVATFDGKPLGGAMIMFLPEKGGNGRPASGVTEPDGKFELSTKEPGDGVLAGSYRAVVTKDLQSNKNAEGAPAQVTRIPKVYTDPELTTLKYSVKQGMNRVELTLTSNP